MSRNPEPRHWTRAKNEVRVADFISITAPVSEFDSITREGDYVRVWRLGGVPFEAASFDDVYTHHQAMCNAVKSLPAGECGLYSYRIQSVRHDRLTDPASPTFSAEFSRQYQDKIASKPFLTKELFLVLAYRPLGEGLAKRLALSNATRESIAAREAKALAYMEEKGAMLERMLRDFEPQRLGVRTEDGVPYWEAGELFSYLVNARWEKKRWPRGPANTTLPNARLFFAAEKLEFRQGDRQRFAAILDIKEYAGDAEPASLGGLLYEQFEFVEAQSFRSLPRDQAQAALKLQRDQMIASEDVALKQIAEMDEAMEQVAEGNIQMGEYHYSLAVFGETIDAASANAAKAIAAVKEGSALELVPVDLLADAAWFAMLPGNYKWRPRKASISSRAFAALACGHNFKRGKRDGNPWGEALIIYRTPAGEGVYFSLQGSPAKEDSEGKKLAGSIALIGPNGSGKTTVLCSWMALLPKFPSKPRLFSFSLHRDTEIIIRALGGRFHRFDRNVPTGLSPMQRAVTPDEVGHWKQLVTTCLLTDGLPLSPDDRADIAKAVQAVSRMPQNLRFFSTVRQSLSRQRGETGVNLYDRFARWCKGGELGWVFDDSDNALQGLADCQALGFDYTGIMASHEVKTVVMMELIHLQRGLLDGRPLAMHIAEAWKALEDPVVFGPFVREDMKTIRKKGGLGILDSQELAEFLSNENGRTAFSQSPTTIWLPDPKANRALYTTEGGLTHAEFDTIKNLGVMGARRFLCKQGTESFVCEFDLSGMDDMLTVLSASKDNVELLDDIRTEVGDDPDVWLPILYERARRGRTSSKTISLPRKAA